MLGEHEIPAGSNLYFGKSARLKRNFETVACDILGQSGFEEIVTPYFTFDNQISTLSAKENDDAIKISDRENNNLYLRADSSIDVIRLITKRLGRSTKHKKWFYIQPVFHYPSTEINQIGAEFMDCDDEASVIKLAVSILTKVSVGYTLQLSNSNIPRLAAAESGLDFELFKNKSITKLKQANIEWLNHLIELELPEDILKVLPKAPSTLRIELEKLYNCASVLDDKNIKIDALYVSGTAYYSGLFFRIFDANEIFVKGGAYKANDKDSFGFSIYTDTVTKQLETESK